MTSILVQASARIIVPIQLVISVLLLLRGHNEPGGGFIGGLVFASAFILHGFAFGLPAALRLLYFSPISLLGCGLLVAAASGFLALFQRLPFMTGVWADFAVQTIVVGKLKFGSPLLFDTGVFLVVAGTVLLMVKTMTEEEEMEEQKKEEG